MGIVQIAERIDGRAAKAFVLAAWNVIDAMMIEADKAAAERTPGAVDYETAGLSREGPAGGWIAPAELRALTQRMSEAITAEKWVEGFVFAIQAIAMLRP